MMRMVDMMIWCKGTRTVQAGPKIRGHANLQQHLAQQAPASLTFPLHVDAALCSEHRARRPNFTNADLQTRAGRTPK
jgi:hypothetical protein